MTVLPVPRVLLLSMVLLLLTGCDGLFYELDELSPENNEPCDEATELECGPHGVCDDIDGEAFCRCDPGYMGAKCEGCADGFERSGDECVQTCEQNDCGGCGSLSAQPGDECGCGLGTYACSEEGDEVYCDFGDADSCCIDGQIYASGDTGNSECQFCDPANEHTQWTLVDDVDEHPDETPSICIIDGECYDQGDTPPSSSPSGSDGELDSECQVCEPALTRRDWSPSCFVDVTAGPDHTCALDEEQYVHCWGKAADGRTEAPQEQFVEIDAAYSHTCGITSDGATKCWGTDDQGESSPPSSGVAQSLQTLSSGRAFTCGLADPSSSNGGDNLVCWGNGDADGLQPGLSIVAVSPDGGTVCISGGSRHVYCESESLESTLGLREFELEFDHIPEHLTIGVYHFCGIAGSGEFDCKTIHDLAEEQGLPTLPFGTDAIDGIDEWGEQLRDLSTHDDYTCSISTSGEIQCAGSDAYTGADGESNQWPNPPTTDAEFTHVTTGGRQNCALDVEGRIHCWGDNTYGQATPPGQ